MVLTGRVDRQQALAFPAGLDPSRPDIGTNWIVFVDPETDLSELTAGCFHDLHKAMRPLTQALAQKGPINVVWACNARLNSTFVAAWRALLRADPDYPSRPRQEKTLAAACSTAGTSEAAYHALRSLLAEDLFAGRHIQGL